MLLQSQTLHSAGLVANNNDDENDNDSSPTVRGESARVATISHTRTVVRECCKGDDASQWRNPNFDPPPRPNPFFFWVLATRYSQGRWTDFDAKYAETRGPAQGCAFSGSRT